MGDYKIYKITEVKKRKIKNEYTQEETANESRIDSTNTIRDAEEKESG